MRERPWLAERRRTGDYWFVTDADVEACALRGHGRIGPGIVRAANGKPQIADHCLTCGTETGTTGTRKSPKAFDLSALPTLYDHTLRSGAPRCERCGARGVELHHWAPVYLFADADNWPTSLLCPACHSLWHQVTRTNGH